VPAGTITGATLKLYSTTASSTGYTVKAESNTTWGESTITYANAPAAGLDHHLGRLHYRQRL
jgi:hypothetical protein